MRHYALHLLTALTVLLLLPSAHHPSAAPAPYGTTPAPASAPPWHPPLAPPDICDTDNEVFQAGEKIVYKLYYNWNFVWIPAGEVTFLVHELPRQYHMMVRGRTYESYEWFYRVRDNYESYLDKETLLPQIHIKDVHEGDYTRYDRTVFDQRAGKAVSSRGRTRDSLEDEAIDLTGCMHDLVSVVYYARNLRYEEMTVGEEIPMQILMDRKVYPIGLKYLGRDERKSVKGIGKWDTQRFSPSLIAGEVFKEGDEMSIWVSNDENRIPVLIESPVVVGSVKAVLQSYEGLRYPVRARL